MLAARMQAVVKWYYERQEKTEERVEMHHMYTSDTLPRLLLHYVLFVNNIVIVITGLF